MRISARSSTVQDFIMKSTIQFYGPTLAYYYVVWVRSIELPTAAVHIIQVSTKRSADEMEVLPFE